MNQSSRRPTICTLVLIAFAAMPNVASAVDLFKKLDIEKATQSGRWERNAKDPDMVRCRVDGAATLDIADEPEGDYTYRVECMRYESEGPFGVYYYFDGKPGTFLVGGEKENGTDGFTLKDGTSTGQNALKGDKAPVVVKNMEAVKIVLTVKGGTLRAKLNGTTVAELKKGQGEIDIFGDIGIGRNKLGLVAMDAGVIFRNAKLAGKKMKAKKSEETPQQTKAEDNPAPEFDVGDKWKGEFIASELSDGHSEMRITNRTKDRYHAVVELGKMGTLEFDFHYQNLHFIAENIVERWSRERQKLTRLEMRIPAVNEVYLSFDYTLNDGRPDKTTGNGHCIYLNYEPKNPKPKPAPKADGGKNNEPYPKLAVGEVWSGIYSEETGAPKTCTLKITDVKESWCAAELNIGDGRVIAFEFEFEHNMKPARNIQDRPKSPKREIRKIEVLRLSDGTQVMIEYALITNDGHKRSFYGQADFIKP
ncbi:MAG: hypothetical protein H6819_05495 [Phycisphaerales bacterium]|nr:hypothetical protein [Phycisphaerales bacterium]MCB9854766.1 hypothetical protein [Phycisphaerales bacterium]MCB9863762.1 hypothetical protein [Phycisphaerales bacterium]